MSMKRLAAAKAIAERDPGETMDQVSFRTDCTRRSLYRYLEDSDFRDLVRELTDQRLVHFMPQIDMAMVSKAIEGSVGAAQFIAQRGGRTTQVTEDKGFSEFLKRLESSDRLSLEYREKYGQWPADDALALPEPKEEQ